MKHEAQRGGDRHGRHRGRWLAAVAAAVLAAPLSALPPATYDPATLTRTGQPVMSISAADGVRGFKPLDAEHVMVSAGDDRYLLTLNGQCVGLRWARHVGVTASDNTIWAGFDALTADGEACPIREIHRLSEADAQP